MNLARVVRKVSNKAVSGQKKQGGIFKNKLFWIIAIVVVVIGVTVGIVLGITLNNNTEDDTNKVDYFATNEEVDFTTASYSSVKNYTNINYYNPQNNESLYVTNAFVFVYNLSSFYPDSDDDSYVKAHADLLSKLVDLQKAIDAQKENGVDVELYIVDSSVGDNSSILYDTNFGGSEEEEITFMFSYIQNGEFCDEKISIKDKEYKLYSTVVSEMLTTIIPQTINYVNAGLSNE